MSLNRTQPVCARVRLAAAGFWMVYVVLCVGHVLPETYAHELAAANSRHAENEGQEHGDAGHHGSICNPPG